MVPGLEPAFKSKRAPASHRPLSLREVGVVSLVIEGWSNDEIAARLGISVKIVES
jgi:DNA-binding NarL/FixJ family response regulator